MKTRLHNELVKVISGLDRALEGWPRDWVSKASEVDPENKLALAELQKEMAGAMGMAEATNNLLIWFSAHHGKIVEGWGPWKRSVATQQETTAINIAFTNYLGTSRLAMDRLAIWEADGNFQIFSKQNMSYLAPILRDIDTMFQQLKGNLNEILPPSVTSDHPEEMIIEIDATAVVRNFARFAAANMINPLLKQDDRGESELDRQTALTPIGMSFVLGFMLASSYRNELEKMLCVSLENPSDVTEFTDMSRMARARGDKLIEKILGTALFNLSVLDSQSVEIGLVIEEASNACELGLRAGVVLPAVDPDINREFRDVTNALNLHPGDEVIHSIIRELLERYEGRLVNDATTLEAVSDEIIEQATDLESLSRVVKDTLAFLTVKEGISPFEFAEGAYHTHQLAKELAYLLIQQKNTLGRMKEGELNVSAFVTLFFAIGRAETWLALWDQPPHPNIVIQGDVDHDFQSWLKTRLPHFNTEEVQRFMPKTGTYQEAVIAEANALAASYAIYADIANKQKN